MTDQLSSEEASLGELVSSATRDLSTLVRKEIELAKLEIKQDVVAAGKGAGMLGGAGFISLLGVIFLGISAAYGISSLGVPLGVGFLAVAIGLLLVAGILALLGKRTLGRITKPEQTIATLKDDASWARHPTVSPSSKA